MNEVDLPHLPLPPWRKKAGIGRRCYSLLQGRACRAQCVSHVSRRWPKVIPDTSQKHAILAGDIEGHLRYEGEHGESLLVMLQGMAARLAHRVVWGAVLVAAFLTAACQTLLWRRPSTMPCSLV